MPTSTLVKPYGGTLMDVTASEVQLTEFTMLATQLPSVQLCSRSMCDLELLATGAMSPLARFMGRDDYLRVLEEMRLSCGRLFPIPVTLNVSDLGGLREGQEIALRSPKNNLVGLMRIKEVFERDPDLEARQVCGPLFEEHPLAAEMRSWGRYAISGPIQVVQLPEHYDFPELRRTPAQVRTLLAALGNPNVVAFQTRNPMHRAHEELTKRAAAEAGASLLIH